MKKYIQPILRALGYYDLKAKWRWRQSMKRWQKIDAQRKAEAIAWIEAIDYRLLPDAKKSGNVTVSLTSHSKRVGDFAPFAIYSIFHQTILPNRIVLNINQDKWSEDNLPELIKKLEVAGLEVNLCEDVGPHTKLLPAMQKYPEDVIITVDDDVYYDKELVEELLTEKKISKDPNVVVCRVSAQIKWEDGKMMPYTQWPNAKANIGTRLSPLGWGGVLYSPHCFTDEVFNKAVYRELCPHADDIWFTVMELVANTPIARVKNTHWRGNNDVNHANEYEVHASDALHFKNVEAGGNDAQLAKLIEHYDLNQYAE